jgi:hypothetical protein
MAIPAIIGLSRSSVHSSFVKLDLSAMRVFFFPTSSVAYLSVFQAGSVVAAQ